MAKTSDSGSHQELTSELAALDRQLRAKRSGAAAS